jgi:hypothetical protein
MELEALGQPVIGLGDPEFDDAFADDGLLAAAAAAAS